MKGGDDFRFPAIHLSLILIILLLMATLLRDKGKDPIFTTQISTPYQSMISSSAPVAEDAPDNSSAYMIPEEQIEETDSSSFTNEERTDQVENVDAPTENFNTSSALKGEGTECNYVKGKWIVDSRRPLYSGSECKWIVEKWRCRQTTRTDFSFEGYRWQPFESEIPEFEPSAFLRKMQGKTIALVGDSLGRQQFQSLMCMASVGISSSEVEDVASEYGIAKLPGDSHSTGLAYRFKNTNTTILFYWSANLSEQDSIDIICQNSSVAMHLDRPPAFLQQYLHSFDVLVLNTGHHWNKRKFREHRWVIYLDGKPNEDKELAKFENAKNFKVHSIIRWLDSQLLLHPGLKAFFRTISPAHFFDGEWNTNGTCDNTIPLTRGSEVLQDGSTDKVVEAAVSSSKVKILDITALSELRDEAHISNYSFKRTKSRYDCLHWCLPGIPDTWNELLAAQL